MDTAADLEAIRRLKYAYFRTLDLKQFQALGELLTDDATASYEDGKTVLEGRAAIVGWLASSLRDPGGRPVAAAGMAVPSLRPPLSAPGPPRFSPPPRCLEVWPRTSP